MRNVVGTPACLGTATMTTSCEFAAGRGGSCTRWSAGGLLDGAAGGFRRDAGIG